jgi:hypothetical protein
MQSPFPGMDPYIEACGLWEGFHGRLIEAIYRDLASVLPSGYTIDTAVQSYVVLMGAEGMQGPPPKPDVTVTEPAAGKQPPKKKDDATVAETSASAESVPMQAFIELDLLRGGHKMPMMTPWPDSPFSLLVSRSFPAPHCRAWPAHFQRRLPVIPMPLASKDPDLTLDLQPLLNGIYSLGRYHERIDYARPLTPPLPDADAGWVRDLPKKRPPRSTGERRRPS